MQALNQYKATQASAIDVGVMRAQLEHAIAVLIGKPPAYFSLPPAPLSGIVPPKIPLQVPSTLLERRPDIAVAERTMASNNALIGVAVAAYFPTIALTGTSGFQANIFHRLFNAPSSFWSFSPSLLQYIFDGGLRRGKLEYARAQYDASVASYRQTVLAAFQNVEDNLAALRILQSESAVLQQDVNAARTALNLVLNNYKSGTADYTDVIVAQVSLLTAEKSYVDVSGRRMTAAVGLIMSLGGGWDTTEITLTPPGDK
jgi:NodT family efflux transporter outer membrane factor (OMF) lipoprotein